MNFLKGWLLKLLYSAPRDNDPFLVIIIREHTPLTFDVSVSHLSKKRHCRRKEIFSGNLAEYLAEEEISLDELNGCTWMRVGSENRIERARNFKGSLLSKDGFKDFPLSTIFYGDWTEYHELGNCSWQMWPRLATLVGLPVHLYEKDRTTTIKKNGVIHKIVDHT